MNRLRSGERLAFAAGVALPVLLSLRWYETDAAMSSGAHLRGWTALSWPVVTLLAISAALALALAFTTVSRRSPAIPVGLGVVTWITAAFATAVLLLQLMAQPGLGLGLAAAQVTLLWPGYVALAVSALIVIGAFLSISDERTDAPGSDYVAPPAREAPAPAAAPGGPGEDS